MANVREMYREMSFPKRVAAMAGAGAAGAALILSSHAIFNGSHKTDSPGYIDTTVDLSGTERRINSTPDQMFSNEAYGLMGPVTPSPTPIAENENPYIEKEFTVDDFNKQFDRLFRLSQLINSAPPSTTPLSGDTESVFFTKTDNSIYDLPQEKLFPGEEPTTLGEPKTYRQIQLQTNIHDTKNPDHTTLTIIVYELYDGYSPRAHGEDHEINFATITETDIQPVRKATSEELRTALEQTEELINKGVLNLQPAKCSKAPNVICS